MNAPGIVTRPFSMMRAFLTIEVGGDVVLRFTPSVVAQRS